MASQAPVSAPPSAKAAAIAQARATVVATTMAAAADTMKMVRTPTCAAYQATTMPRRTAQTTGGRAITRDLRAAAATATATQGAGLGLLLGEVRGIAIGIAIKIEIKIEIEIEVDTGSELAIGTVPGGLAGVEAKCQATKTTKTMTKS